MTNIIFRPIVVLKLPLDVASLLKTGLAIVAAMTKAGSFTNPPVPLATVSAQLAALATAETATKTRAAGTVAARNQARLAVVQSMHDLKGYVQTLANASPDTAETIIANAGMTSRKPPARTKAPFEVTAGSTSGSVKLVAKAAARRASYEWSWSADGGKTWTTLPVTLQARTTITGIASGTNGLFRFRPVTKTGESDWSTAVPFLVK